MLVNDIATKGLQISYCSRSLKSWNEWKREWYDGQFRENVNSSRIRTEGLEERMCLYLSGSMCVSSLHIHSTYMHENAYTLDSKTLEEDCQVKAQRPARRILST
jgi:hypothetical protein